ncbi:MAG TPA: hypothetical protein VEQ37_09785 [Actinomycetota bacterium]|nr:hypothetical protein [Actinomycetota bacterium]
MDQLKGKFNKKVGRASENPNREITGEAQQVKGQGKAGLGESQERPAETQEPVSSAGN